MTGWYDFRTRDLIPGEGRWAERDPLGSGGGDLNLYRYVGNEPAAAQRAAAAERAAAERGAAEAAGRCPTPKGAAPKGVPMTLKEVDLPGRIRQAGGATLKEAGEFFGWKARSVTKTAADFTKDQLLAKGWTKERLLCVAEGYEYIARITPKNPSAAGRAAQLREIAKLFD